MKKILDLLLIIIISILLVNLWNGNSDPKLDGTILFKATDNSYTIPASVGLGVTNNSQQAINFNTCDNIILNYNGEALSFPKEFCKDMVVNSGESATINYSDFYDHFEKTGTYIFKINFNDKEYISQFEIENKGSISKIFIALFYAPLYNLLVFLMSLMHSSLGAAIIGITIIIRILLLYPQHKMMVSQKKLQAIQPKIKEIQAQYKGQQQVLGIKLMELYKKEKVNPMGSCGFLLIQMPILIVIYNIILSIKDPANYYYIYNILSGFDVASIDYNFFGLNLLQSGGIQGFILALVVGGIQFMQVKLSLASNKNKSGDVVLEKKPGTEGYSQFMPDPEMMNKFMLYGMPAMVVVFTFTLYAGVGIYWGIGTFFMLIQQLIVNKMLKK